MTDNSSEKPAAHLTPLPEKSFSIKPGEVVGGLVYVMDKPLGIEDGMVGISVDSLPYLEFIKGKMIILDNKPLHDESLDDASLRKHFKELPPQYVYIDPLSSDDEKTKCLDQQAKDLIGFKKEKNPKEVNVFAQLMFELYQKKLLNDELEEQNKGVNNAEPPKRKGIISKMREFLGLPLKIPEKTKKEKMDEISRLIKAGNEVYMVKQDGEMILGRTGPSIDKISKTTTGKAVKKWTFGVGLYFWKANYLRKNDPVKVNSDAITEVMATKIADAKGFTSQTIETIDGTYKNGAPKIATIVTWTVGCQDLGGRLGGSKDHEGVLVKDIDSISVSDDSIYGLGESLITLISLGDRDGIGSKGQNKAIIPLTKEEQALTGNKFTHQFYGIDFGKSYQKATNPIVGSLQDDFSFTNPGDFKNYSMLYDNPLRDKMKGVYMLAALRGKLKDPEKKNIAKDYHDTDPIFEAKLIASPKQVNGDLKLIEQEIRKYNNLAAECRFGDKKNSKKEKEYELYVARLKEIKKNSVETDRKILQVFEQRLKLTPSQIDLIDNLEKLTAKKATMLSPDGKVLLNHIRVQSKDRIKWQLEDMGKGNYKLSCNEFPGVIEKLNSFLRKHNTPNSENQHDVELWGIFNPPKLDKQKAEYILNEDQLKAFSEFLTEKNVASWREDTQIDFAKITELKKSSQIKKTEKLEKASQATPDAKPQATKPSQSPIAQLQPDLAPPPPSFRRSQSAPPPKSSKPPLIRTYTAKPARLPRGNTTTNTQPTPPNMATLTSLLTADNLPNMDMAPEDTATAAGDNALRNLGGPPFFNSYSNGTTGVLASNHPIAIQENASLNTMMDYSVKDAFKHTHPNILALTLSSKPEGDDKIKEIHVTLKDKSKEGSKEILVTVQENPDAKQLKYIAQKKLTPEEFDFAAKETCRLAVFSAKNNAVFDFSKAPADKIEFLEATFMAARKEAMERKPPQFTQEAMPRLRSELPPTHTARAVLK